MIPENIRDEQSFLSSLRLEIISGVYKNSCGVEGKLRQMQWALKLRIHGQNPKRFSGELSSYNLPKSSKFFNYSEEENH